MGAVSGGTAATAVIAAMLTPALLILASVSLVASALVRMGRVVDRTRALAALVNDGTWERGGLSRELLRTWLDRHAARARHVERTILLLYAAVVVFVMTCLSIGVDRAVGGTLDWLPVSLAIAGTLLLLAAGALMVVESKLSGDQVQEEVRLARARLDGTGDA